jgi:RNA polymerase sigma factor (sigma-70 family)
MQSKSDAQLLREYAANGSEIAFTELVRRHTNLVYSAAARQVADADTAGEVAQNVFIALARGAEGLAGRVAEDASLAGWLCRSARNIALNVRRNEFRKHSRERLSVEQQVDSGSEMPADWEQLGPALDDAMSELSEPDYDALVMRFFQNQDLRTIGKALGVSDDTAQKRVTRALDKLRNQLCRRGIRSSATALSIVISANAVQSAPLSLSATIFANTALSAATVKCGAAGLANTLFMTTVQKTLITTAIVATIGTGVYEARRASQWQEQASALKQQRDVLTEENRQLREESDSAAKKLSAALQGGDGAPDSGNELQRLRGEVSRLRESARELANFRAAATATGSDSAMDATLKTWSTRAAQLKQRLEEMPEKKIPELQLISEKEWFDAIKNGKPLQTDADFRQAAKDLRDIAKSHFADMTRGALKKFAEANNGSLPTDLGQLKPYFDAPVDDAILQRYSMLQSGKLSDAAHGENLFGENGPAVDDEFDSHYEFSMNGTSSWSVSDPGDIVFRGLREYAKAHQGLLPSDPSQLTPFLQRQVEPSKVQSFLSMIPAGVTTLKQLNAIEK